MGFVAAYFSLKRSVKKHLDPAAVLEEIRRDVDGLVVELNQTAERNVAILEDKIGTLSGVIERADSRVKILRTERERYDQALDAYRSLGETNRAAAPEAAAGEAEAEMEPDLRERVMRLHRSGLSVATIARRVQKMPGEVELIISLSEHEEDR